MDPLAAQAEALRRDQSTFRGVLTSKFPRLEPGYVARGKDESEEHPPKDGARNSSGPLLVVYSWQRGASESRKYGTNTISAVGDIVLAVARRCLQISLNIASVATARFSLLYTNWNLVPATEFTATEFTALRKSRSEISLSLSMTALRVGVQMLFCVSSDIRDSSFYTLGRSSAFRDV